MQVSPQHYRLVTTAALGALVAIVITGAAVRLTGSGLGCDDWPNCNDERLVDVSSGHAAIEQVNRLFTGLVAAAVIAAVLASLWRAPRRRDLTWLSLGLVAGVVAQVVLGGITVLVDLHPVAVQGHMLLSLALVATAVVLVHRAGEPDGARRRAAVAPTTARLVWVLAACTAVAIIAGTVVTGAGPHAGDEDVQRFDVAITTATRVHSVAVLVTLTIGAWIALRLMIARSVDRQALMAPLSSWLVLGALQAVVGYVQYWSDVPPLLVGVHVALATLLWAQTVRLVLATAKPALTADSDRGPAVSGSTEPLATL